MAEYLASISVFPHIQIPPEPFLSLECHSNSEISLSLSLFVISLISVSNSHLIASLGVPASGVFAKSFPRGMFLSILLTSLSFCAFFILVFFAVFLVGFCLSSFCAVLCSVWFLRKWRRREETENVPDLLFLSLKSIIFRIIRES